MKMFEQLYEEIEKEALCNPPRNIFADLEKEENYSLVLYGAGGGCKYTLFECEMARVSVSCICDSSATGKYRYKAEEYDIISLNILLEEYRDAYVLITTWKYAQEIYDNLRLSGFSTEKIYFLHYPYLMTPMKFREMCLDGYRWAYEFFEDERSKTRILDRIRLVLMGRPGEEDSSHAEGYFAYPKISLENQEVYIDGGAYIGDTAEEFVKVNEENRLEYRHIYSFDPDPQNYEKALANLEQYDNIDVFPYGLWSSKKELKFTNDKESSSYVGVENEENAIIIPVVSLDEFFAEKPTDEWPTIIKMDIEGSEKEALIGATQVIREKKPKLVICAYHKPEDIYELPQTILKIRSDYKFELWQIGESFWDMILYAI